MAKKKITSKILNYGQYKKWDKTLKSLPEPVKITDSVTTELDVEFGYILEIKGAKGKSLDFIIEHPPFLDENGEVTPPFEGSEFINSNAYRFYLGDKIWAPVEDKSGDWIMKTYLEGTLLAEKTIRLVPKENYSLDW